MNEVHQKVKEKLRERFGGSVLEESYFRDELTFIVKRDSLVDMLEFLRSEDDLKYIFLTDLTATDWPDREQRHEIIYLVYSFDSHTYVRLKVRCREGEKMPTVTHMWDTANWLEREVFDLFGVDFEGHPDMTRILMWEDFEGHPLRKDFPLTYEVPNFSHNIDDPPEVIK